MGGTRSAAGLQVNWSGDVEPPDHHLIPALRTPEDRRSGIGIERVIGRVVEDGMRLNAGSPREQLGRLKVIVRLPIEIVMRDVEQRFRLAAGIDRAEYERLAAQVHMRTHADQKAVLAHDRYRRRLIIRFPRRNRNPW